MFQKFSVVIGIGTLAIVFLAIILIALANFAPLVQASEHHWGQRSDCLYFSEELSTTEIIIQRFYQLNPDRRIVFFVDATAINRHWSMKSTPVDSRWIKGYCIISEGPK